MSHEIAKETRYRAERSGGRSDAAIYEMVRKSLSARGISGAVAVDLGCGNGELRNAIGERFGRDVGLDAVRYNGFPETCSFVEADLNSVPYPVESKFVDAVFAVETIEHLENPRALLREMARIAKPGGWIIVTTPNQLSALSLLTLLFKRRFSAFQDAHYPAHITALLESDFFRIGNELGLNEQRIEYSRSGRIILTGARYPKVISSLFPRLCSDNILFIARAP
jgi:SAM-dependent methyltransferase